MGSFFWLIVAGTHSGFTLYTTILCNLYCIIYRFVLFGYSEPAPTPCSAAAILLLLLISELLIIILLLGTASSK